MPSCFAQRLPVEHAAGLLGRSAALVGRSATLVGRSAALVDCSTALAWHHVSLNDHLLNTLQV